MKNLFYVLALLPFAGCHSGKSAEQTAVVNDSVYTKAARVQTASASTAHAYVTLLDKYKAISLDTLKITGAKNNGDSTYAFAGHLLDSTEKTLLPGYVSQKHSAQDLYYACYKFRFDSTHFGLITRVPGKAYPSAVKLYILEAGKGLTPNTIELADTWVDGGEGQDKTSWLFKNDSNQLQVLVRSHQTILSSDDPQSAVLDQSDKYYLLLYKNGRADTTGKEQRIPPPQFRHLVSKRD